MNVALRAQLRTECLRRGLEWGARNIAVLRAIHDETQKGNFSKFESEHGHRARTRGLRYCGTGYIVSIPRAA